MKQSHRRAEKRERRRPPKRMDRRGRTSLTIIVSLFVFCMLCAAIGLAVLGVAPIGRIELVVHLYILPSCVVGKK